MKHLAILGAAVMLLAVTHGAGAQQRQAALGNAATAPSAFLGIFGETRPPIGWVQFCRERSWECRSEMRQPRDAVMNRQRWNELTEINRRVNRDIEPVTDQELYGVAEHWTYPTDNRGDCEDYVLLKRRQLIERGWPESALLITVVRDTKGDGHAVLTVRTTEGDFILDNVRDEILPWSQTGYRFVKRQSQWAPNIWVSLPDDTGRGPATTAR
jgi:predicted transglutaminase-like cysteine proteinase